MIRAVLIDDEEHALDLLDIMLAEIGGVTVVGKFLRASDALNEMARLEADLAFLDIEMPGMNGLAAAERLMSVNPGLTIVFVTAYQHYAIDAFDLEAMDYLLKPVSRSRLLKALDRFHKKREPHRREAASEATEPMSASKDGLLPLRLNVLGSLELYDAGHNLVSWRTRKVKELFAYLWYTQGAPAHRHRIVSDLWPDTEAMRAQPLFHTTLYHLRSLLKKLGYPNAISFADERYVMRTDFIQSDVDMLKDLSDKTGMIKEWLVLYRGDLMEDEDYPWAVPIRLQLRTDYARMLEQNAPAGTGEEQEAIWRKLIALEPYSEAYYDKLLQLLAETGNVAAIRKLYDELRDRLGKELGLQPSNRIISFMDKYR